jgi:8-amino-3,8-dideoxy-alpha-D-manno-octulosonate transaminase
MPGTEVFGAEERKEVMDVLETGVLFRYGHERLRRGMWKARELEDEVRRFTGARYAHAVSSGSTAVACALAGAGIGHGDRVIVPPFTFLATIEAVLLAGALPVFAEIDETLCLSADGIRAAASPETRAVLLVHMCGAAADMEPILNVCRKNDLVLVEDAGQALGAFHGSTSVGLFGKTGCFSFDFFKITTCGEGGVLITDDEEAYRLADTYSDHGHAHVGDNRGMEPHPILGFNYRIGELSAAVGLAQMRKLEWMRDRKRENKAILKNRLAEVPGVTFRRVPDPDGDSATFLNFFLPDAATAAAVVGELGREAVPGVNYWFENMYHFINQWDHLKELRSAAPLAIHALGAPQDYSALQLPRSQEVIGRLISLGIRCTWESSEVEDVGDRLVRAVGRALRG